MKMVLDRPDFDKALDETRIEFTEESSLWRDEIFEETD